MKTIGLIGGLSWEASAEYYRILNEVIRERCGGLYSAQVLMWSFNFTEIEALQSSGRWDEATVRMIEAAQRLERGGADFIVICANTMHRMADEVQAQIAIPILHIADATAEQIKRAGLHRIGLLGTRYTMEEPFYKDRLIDRFRLEVIVPNVVDRQMINRVIYDELCRGIVNPASRYQCTEVIQKMIGGGVQGIILGCTELMLPIKPEDSSIPQFDTTTIHAHAAVDWALS
ncbi:MAG: aspartate/glutamate racemase family protein [Anaerolineae bacterium]|nr:aspartate/glutamate racemase family protein [Anaerolineae bacterium]